MLTKRWISSAENTPYSIETLLVAGEPVPGARKRAANQATESNVSSQDNSSLSCVLF